MKAIEEPNILTYRESKRRALDGDDQPLFRKFGVYKEARGAFVSRAPQSSIVFDVLRHNVSPGTSKNVALLAVIYKRMSLLYNVEYESN